MNRSHDLKGLKVLVVDDTATNQQLLQIFLTKLGCRVVLAADGAQAVDVYRRELPDLVFMDVMMPVMDGYEATRQIKALAGSRWVPVVFLSALDKDENLVIGLDAGGDDYLAKPVNFVVLSAKVRSLARALALQRSLDEARRRTAAISDNIDDCVITIDEDGRIQSVNAAAGRIFGYEAAELLGRNVNILMPEPYRSEHDAHVRAYVDGAPARVIGVGNRRAPGLRKDSSEVQLELAVTEMRHDGERLFIGILRDIGDRLAAEDALREHAMALQRYYDQREAENALAGGVMRRLLLQPGLSDSRLQRWLQPASDFSGDVVAAKCTPDDKLYAMLADAAGHGLAAAISVLPVLTTFYQLVEQGYPVGYVAHEVNRQLIAFIPTGRFVAATLVCFDRGSGRTDVWLGGMPDLVLMDGNGKVLRRLSSTHLPLGIADFDEHIAGVETIETPPGTQLVLFSDGIIEAANPEGEAFGVERVIAELSRASSGERLPAVQAALTSHRRGQAVADDMSLLLIDC
jgi:PAS domain S-box-containing protein